MYFWEPREITLHLINISLFTVFTDAHLLLIAEDEEPVATPLIPLMEECETALEDKLFQKFLYTIGINPPVDEQVDHCSCFQTMLLSFQMLKLN